MYIDWCASSIYIHVSVFRRSAYCGNHRYRLKCNKEYAHEAVPDMIRTRAAVRRQALSGYQDGKSEVERYTLVVIEKCMNYLSRWRWKAKELVD